MNRRSFLQAILVAGVAPAIVRADNLMKIVVPTTEEVAHINGIERFRIDADGITSYGIDDYEEGTYTPTIIGDARYITAQGRYTRVGKMVYLNTIINHKPESRIIAWDDFIKGIV